MSAPTPDAPATPIQAGQQVVADVKQDIADPTPADIGKTVSDVGTLVSNQGIANVFKDAPKLVRGVKTSEFWVVIATIAADLGLNISTKTQAAVSASGGLYALARGLAKKTG